MNTNSPIYFHTIVTADTPSLTTGGEDANKENMIHDNTTITPSDTNFWSYEVDGDYIYFGYDLEINTEKNESTSTYDRINVRKEVTEAVDKYYLEQCADIGFSFFNNHVQEMYNTPSKPGGTILSVDKLNRLHLDLNVIDGLHYHIRKTNIQREVHHHIIKLVFGPKG